MTTKQDIALLTAELKALRVEMDELLTAFRFIARAPQMKETLQYYEQRLVFLWNNLVNVLYRIEQGETTAELATKLTEFEKELIALHDILKHTYLAERITRMIGEIETAKTFLT